ncbi:hypothetical protein [Xaviernesmea oryzae]|uniref:hypothetical protein n=1 Tax=Xaviernesmea oryzae TaxID=464029 RepID=UPI0008BDECAD|nr:hypothetical protein [Xaviernesmea oryzae]SEK86685.1 hypothetical protein SAMN04487976_104233 [Xaviernesmea oryzae]
MAAPKGFPLVMTQIIMYATAQTPAPGTMGVSSSRRGNRAKAYNHACPILHGRWASAN